MIKYRCPNCGDAMESPATMIGEVEACPSCGTSCVVPPPPQGIPEPLSERPAEQRSEQLPEQSPIPSPPTTKKGKSRAKAIAVVFLLLVATGALLFTLWMARDDVAGLGTSPTEIRRITINTSNPIEVLNTVVSPRGGTIEVADSHSPLDGLQMTIKANAYDEPCEVELSYAPITFHSGLDGFNPISPMIMIETSEHYAASAISLRVPVTIPKDHVAMGFYYDPESGKLEALPTIAGENGTVVLLASHFSYVLISSMTKADLTGRIMSSFEPGMDDWSFPNHRTVVAPNAMCSGMSISAVWYFVEKATQGEARLHERFDSSTPDLWQDDALGLKLASIVQDDSRFDNALGRILDWVTKDIVVSDRQTYNQFAGAIQATGQPQLIGLSKPLARTGHMMIVYGVDDDTLPVADPNHPREAREIRLVNGKFEGYDVNDTKLTTMTFIGQTALVRWDTLTKRWTELDAGTIGDGQFPTFTLRGVLENQRSIPMLSGMSVPPGKLTVTAENEGDAMLFCDVFPMDLSDIMTRDGYLSAPIEGSDIELEEGEQALRVAVFQIGDDDRFLWMGFSEIDVVCGTEPRSRTDDMYTFGRLVFEAVKNDDHELLRQLGEITEAEMAEMPFLISLDRLPDTHSNIHYVVERTCRFSWADDGPVWLAMLAEDDLATFPTIDFAEIEAILRQDLRAEDDPRPLHQWFNEATHKSRLEDLIGLRESLISGEIDWEQATFSRCFFGSPDHFAIVFSVRSQEYCFQIETLWLTSGWILSDDISGGFSPREDFKKWEKEALLVADAPGQMRRQNGALLSPREWDVQEKLMADLYKQGQKAYEARLYAQAAGLFERVRDEFPGTVLSDKCTVRAPLARAQAALAEGDYKGGFRMESEALDALEVYERRYGKPALAWMRKREGEIEVIAAQRRSQESFDLR